MASLLAPARAALLRESNPDLVDRGLEDGTLVPIVLAFANALATRADAISHDDSDESEATVDTAMAIRRLVKDSRGANQKLVKRLTSEFVRVLGEV